MNGTATGDLGAHDGLCPWSKPCSAAPHSAGDYCSTCGDCVCTIIANVRADERAPRHEHGSATCCTPCRTCDFFIEVDALDADGRCEICAIAWQAGYGNGYDTGRKDAIRAILSLGGGWPADINDWLGSTGGNRAEPESPPLNASFGSRC